MNYLETGLPHQDLYRKKSDFVPPRYKPLCSLGRRYLGLDPCSKTEIKAIINRLCQPKKPPEPEDPSNFTRKIRPVVSGTGRFNGRKRMTGGQISKMVDRLTKKKTEIKSDGKDNTKDNQNMMEEDDHNYDDQGENHADSSPFGKEIPYSSPRRGTEISLHGRNVHFERKESTVSHLKDVNQLLESDRVHERNVHNDSSSIKQEGLNASQTFGGSPMSASGKKPKQNQEEERYESLYYRGVKTEIARKAFNQNKRSSVHIVRPNHVETIKSAKTDISSAPHPHPKLDDVHNRRPRLKTS